ncbi:MAG: hypothetical protein KAK00_03210 [Nanoarchaeota archaeon]|nr:hypothetical protein [Nanoarchaeota archaeon]
MRIHQYMLLKAYTIEYHRFAAFKCKLCGHEIEACEDPGKISRLSVKEARCKEGKWAIRTWHIAGYGGINCFSEETPIELLSAGFLLTYDRRV